MPIIVSFAGTSNSGKTTLIEKLVPELVRRGYRVASAKHSVHKTTMDEQGKDSWRHLEAGSEATVLVSPDNMFLSERIKPDITLDEVVRRLGEDYDIIIAEGFKRDKAPKIEVHRKEAGPPLKNLENLIAIASDEPLKTETRQFSLEDINGLVDLIEETVIKPQGDRLSLYINDKPVPLKEFPLGIITNILTGMAASLRGVDKVKTIKLFLRKKD